jgi:hypothetical protein
MTYCEHCGEQISYLPFKCKYCGGNFCQKHRLPENHDCAFELKNVPLVSGTLGQKNLKLSGSTKTSKDFKKYMKRQDKQKRKPMINFDSYASRLGRISGTSFLIIMILIFSLASLAYPLYLNLSSYSFLNFYIWTFFTSLFVSYTSDFFGLFFLIILILFFNIMIRNIEHAFGTTFLLRLYFLCALVTGGIYFILWVLIQLLYLPLGIIITVPFGLASGALIGVISFIIFLNIDKEMTFLIFIIPIRMKGKTIITLLILLNLIPGLLFAIGSIVYLIIYLPDLGGILASYLVYYFRFKKRKI